MPNTGNLFPGTAETLARGAGTAWSFPLNVLSDNATDSECDSGGSGSAYLVSRNFGLALATGDTVGGITIRVEASEHSGGTEVLTAQLQDNTGALIGTAKTLTLSGTSKTIYTYGSTTDVWGATLTETIVNSANFGVRLWFTTTHRVLVDFVTAAVEYALAPVTGEGGPFPPGVFPGPIFPGEVFPGGGAGEVGDSLTSVEATTTVGTVVPSVGLNVTEVLTGVTASVGFSVGGFGGPVFPEGVFPGEVFPEPIFPSGPIEGAITDSGIGIVVPNTHKTLPSVELSATVGFISAEGNEVAVLSGVAVSVAVGTPSTARSKALIGVASTVAVGTVTRSAVVGGIQLTGVTASIGTTGGVGGAAWGDSWGTSWGSSWGTGSGSESDSGIGILIPSHQKSFSGVQATANVEAVEEVRIHALTGVTLQAQVGFVVGGSDALANLTGVQVTAAVGSVGTNLSSYENTVSVGTVVVSLAKGLTTVVSTATTGTLVATRTQAITGVTAQATIGSIRVSPTVGITPVTASVAVGSITTGTRSVTLTGVSLSVEKFALQGNQVSVAVGSLTAIPVLAGVQVTASVGFVTAGADALVNLTGVAITVAVETLGVGGRSQELSGVVVTATVGTVASAEALAISGVEATVNVGTLVPIADREAALTGFSVAVNIGLVPAQSDVVVLLTTIACTALVGTVEALRIKTLDGVTLSAAIGTIAPISDREQALTGVVVNVSAGFISRDAIPLTGVSLSAAVESLGKPLLIKTLWQVSLTANVGHTPKEGDVILDTVGVDVGAGVLGILGVVSGMPVGTYRHVAPGPARNGRIRDLEELEREMALMEE